MRDPPRETDLLLEAVEQRGVQGQHVPAQGLDRDEVVELAVVRLVDDAHSALADHRMDLVATRKQGVAVPIRPFPRALKTAHRELRTA